MPSTPSSTDTARRPARGALIALVVVSLAIPAAILAFVLHGNSDKGADPTTAGTVPGTPHKARVGNLAPDFTLPALGGGTLTLSSLRGKPVVLTFFASWCHPCEEDMPLLEKLQQSEGGKVAVVGVNYQDFEGDTRDFVRRLGVTFPALVEDSSTNPVAARYDVHAMPDTLFIDANGVVRDRVFGQTDTTDLQRAIDKLRAS